MEQNAVTGQSPTTNGGIDAARQAGCLAGSCADGDCADGSGRNQKCAAYPADGQTKASPATTTLGSPLLRRLSLTSLLAMLVTATILISLYQRDQFAEHEGIAAQENEKTALSLIHLLDNQINTFIAATEGLDSQALHANPDVSSLATAITGIREHQILKLKIFNQGGEAVFSTVPGEIGGTSNNPALLAKALQGGTLHQMEFSKTFLSHTGELHDRYVAETYMPLTHAGKRIGVLEIYADATPIIDRIYSKTISIALIVFCIFAAMYAALFFFVLRTDRAIAKWRQMLSEDAQKLTDSETRLRATIDTALDAVVGIDATGKLIEFNPAAETIFGWKKEQVIGLSMVDTLIPERYRRAHLDGLAHSLQTGEAPILNSHIEISALRCDGSEFPIELSVTAIREGDHSYFTGYIRDITERKEAEQQISNLAFYDPLTQLPNRRLLIDRLQQVLVSNDRNKRQGALLLIDLDNFKVLNDTQGHDTGDLMLIEAATRIQNCVRQGDTAARLGGDEFVVLLEDLDPDEATAASQAEAVGEKICFALEQTYHLKGSDYRSTASIGATLLRGPVKTADEMLRRADVGLYQAKADGRNTLRFFDPDLQALVMARVDLETDLRRAVSGQEQFLLYYQAQVDSSGRLNGVEALLRWRHPVRGMVPPSEFIPLAEDTGLILPLGHWVLSTACQQLATWAACPAMAHLTMAVNVSPKQFGLPTFVDEVLALVDYFGVNPANLKLEITESMLLDNVDEVIAKMTSLKAKGINFSLDDFGTGYSSLSYLKRLPLYQLKIDQSFVRDVLTDHNDAAIAKTIVALSSSMGLAVIAEGLETEGQRDFLALHGCHNYQGYFFSHPLPIVEFDEFVNSKYPSDPTKHNP